MAAEDFKRLFESLRVPVVVADREGAVRFANEAFTGLVGMSSGVLQGAKLASLFPGPASKRLQQNIARVAEGKAASAMLEARLAPPGMESTWVSVALQPCLDARAQANGVVAVLQETGAQRETDEALNLVSARLLAVAEGCPVALMIETAPGDIEVANEAFCRLLALDSAPQSLSGLPAMEAIARSPLVDARALDKLRRKAAQVASLAVRREDGTRGALERTVILVDGEPAGAVWLQSEDLGGGAGEKGAAEVALIEKIGEELSIALEGISAISIRAQQMDFDPALVEHFQRIRRSTETAMAAIGDLVDFSSVSGGVVLRKAGFALRPTLAELLGRLATTAEECGCRLRLKVEQDVPDLLVGDVERLQLVLRNLVDNAFALLPGAEVLLQITPEYTTESGIQLSFAVLASGGPAQQGAKVAAEAGMGVAVAKFMVAAMGGTLAVASRAGADALYGFTIEFPVLPSPPPPPRRTYVSLVGMPVLLVSADATQRLALAGLLRGWRMLPLEADNAPMAMALLERMHQESTPVPLVITANRLPVQDGFLLAFRIRHDPRFAATLVMMLASDGRPGDAIACRENGIAAYMRYPIPDRQLNEAIVAVTGASVDADEAPTLVTRHSLREQRKGATILLVDASRDSQILAAHVLGRRDCSIVVAQDLQEALASLDQDLYDIVLVDTALEGLDGPDAVGLLRGRITRAPEATRIIATGLGHSPAFREAALARGFDGTLAKPFRKEDLLALVGAG